MAMITSSPLLARRVASSACHLPSTAGVSVQRPASSLLNRLPGSVWRSSGPSIMGPSIGGSGGSGGGSVIRRTASGGSGGEGQAGPGGPWGYYLQLLEAHPNLVKAVTCALLNAVGDVVCQIWFSDGHDFDWKRLAKFTAMGFFVVAPILNVWYTQLNARVTMGGTGGAILRMALDQLLFAPVFLSIFISVLFAVDGKASSIRPKLEQDLWSTVQANWILWVPAQFLNFRFVPANLTVLCSNVTALLWNVYMSHATHKAVAPTAALAAAVPAAAPVKGKKK